MEDNQNEVKAMSEKFGTLAEKIEKDVATKRELKEHAELFTKMIEKQRVERERAEKHPIFGTKALADTFVDVLATAAERGNSKLADHGSILHKDNLNITTASDALPTATSEVLSFLMKQGGVARRYSTVYTGVRGSLVLPKRTGSSTAAFTANDDSSVTPDAFGVGKVTLTPKQVSAISQVSNQALYSSAVDLASNVAVELVENAAAFEDTVVISGAGISGDGLLADTDVVDGTETAHGSIGIEEALELMGLVAEEVQNSENAAFYMNGKTLTAMRTKKASTSGVFHIDPSTGGFVLGGRPIRVWHRLPDLAAGSKSVFFGDMEKASVLSVGREMGIEVSSEAAFAKNASLFRLTYDFDADIIQPKALARTNSTPASST